MGVLATHVPHGFPGFPFCLSRPSVRFIFKFAGCVLFVGAEVPIFICRFMQCYPPQDFRMPQTSSGGRKQREHMSADLARPEHLGRELAVTDLHEHVSTILR